MGLLLAVLSALMYGSADFAGGFAARRSSSFAVVVVSQIFGVAIALVAAPLLGPNAPTGRDLAWGAAAGLAGALGLVTLYRGIASGLVSVVSPTAAVLGAVVPLLFGLLVGEHPPLLSWVGTALCLPATALLSMGEGDADFRRATLRSFVFGSVAGLSFGAFFICISRPSPEAGLWPLVAARAVSIGAVASVALAAGRRPFKIAGGIAAVALAGVLDMGANIAFVLSTRWTLLALATVIVSLYPGPTVLLGRLLFRERLGQLRLLGLAGALAGVALIGAGSG